MFKEAVLEDDSIFFDIFRYLYIFIDIYRYLTRVAQNIIS